MPFLQFKTGADGLLTKCLKGLSENLQSCKKYFSFGQVISEILWKHIYFTIELLGFPALGYEMGAAINIFTA